MFVRLKTKGKYHYLQLVENHREGYRTVQRVLCSLGRREELEACGSIDVLLRSLARFGRQVEPKESHKAGDLKPGKTRAPTETCTRRDRQPTREGVLGMPAPNLAGMTRTAKSDWLIDSKVSPLSRYDSRADILRKSGIFSDLDEDYLIELSRIAQERHVKSGQFLFFEGDLVDCLYLVVTGSMKVLKHSPTGKDFIMALDGPGEILGNVLLYLGKPHPTSVQAATDTTLLVIKNEDFLTFISRHPESSSRILSRLLNIAGKRLAEATARLAEMATEDVQYRLARVLFSLFLKFEGAISLTRRDIAEMAGTTTESAIRFLSRLRQEGVVRTERTKIVVLEPRKLRKLAEDNSH